MCLQVVVLLNPWVYSDTLHNHLNCTVKTIKSIMIFILYALACKVNIIIKLCNFQIIPNTVFFTCIILFKVLWMVTLNNYLTKLKFEFIRAIASYISFYSNIRF